MISTASVSTGGQPLDFRLFADSSSILQQVTVVLSDWYKQWDFRIGIVEYYGEEKVVPRHAGVALGTQRKVHYGFYVRCCNLKESRISEYFVGVLPTTRFLEQQRVIRAYFVKCVYL